MAAGGEETITGSSHCGGDANGLASNGEHCHGAHRLCAATSSRWVTVSGTYTATSEKTTVALHSESALTAYFDRVLFTEAVDQCTQSFESQEGPTRCNCMTISSDNL